MRPTRSMLAVAAISLIAGGSIAPVAAARQGADDPPAHNARDDHGGKRIRAKAARHGADDRPGDDRRGRGADDGPNHR